MTGKCAGRIVTMTMRTDNRLLLDIKKLGRIGSVGHRISGRYPGAVNRHHGIGWEFVHVCIDDASRVVRNSGWYLQHKPSLAIGAGLRSRVLKGVNQSLTALTDCTVQRLDGHN
jgi:hypothetical protein